MILMSGVSIAVWSLFYARSGILSGVPCLCGHKVGSSRIHQKYGGRTFSLVFQIFRFFLKSDNVRLFRQSNSFFLKFLSSIWNFK